MKRRKLATRTGVGCLLAFGLSAAIWALAAEGCFGIDAAEEAWEFEYSLYDAYFAARGFPGDVRNWVGGAYDHTFAPAEEVYPTNLYTPEDYDHSAEGGALFALGVPTLGLQDDGSFVVCHTNYRGSTAQVYYSSIQSPGDALEAAVAHDLEWRRIGIYADLLPSLSGSEKDLLWDDISDLSTLRFASGQGSLDLLGHYELFAICGHDPLVLPQPL